MHNSVVQRARFKSFFHSHNHLRSVDGRTTYMESNVPTLILRRMTDAISQSCQLRNTVCLRDWSKYALKRARSTCVAAWREAAACRWCPAENFLRTEAEGPLGERPKYGKKVTKISLLAMFSPKLRNMEVGRISPRLLQGSN